MSLDSDQVREPRVPLEPGAPPRRLWSSSATLSAARVIGALASAASLILLARHLLLDEFGRYTFYLALFVWFDGLCDLGTSTAALERSGGRLSVLFDQLPAVRRIRAATATLAILVVAWTTWIFDEPGAAWIVVAASCLWTRTWESSVLTYQVRIRWGFPVLVRIGTALLRLGAVVGLIWLDGGFAGEGQDDPGSATYRASHYLFAWSLIGALGNVILHARTRASIAPPAERVPVRVLFAKALPFGLAVLFQQAYFYVDNLFVRSYGEESELGLYNACVRVFGFLVLIPVQLTNVALPWLVRRHAAGELPAALRRVGEPVLVLGAVVFGWALVDAGTWLELLFGPAFLPAAGSLRWLAGAALAVHAGAVLLVGLSAAGQAKKLLLVSICALGLNVTLNAVLVPHHGAQGAAAATAATELCVGGLALWFLARAGTLPRPRARVLLLALAAGSSTAWLAHLL